MKDARFVRLATVVLLACATLGEETRFGLDSPSAGAGPFRALAAKEVVGVAPFVIDSRFSKYRSPSAIDDGGDVVLFFAVTDQKGAASIARSRASDGRSFFGAAQDTGHEPLTVLRPSETWEGGQMGDPCAVRVGTDIWVYYSSNDGIGLATSTSGRNFAKKQGPVLTKDSREGGAVPQAPSVLRLPDGEWRMFYVAGTFIREARSTDGIHFERLDAIPETASLDPVLGPSGSGFDSDAVGDPHAFARLTSAGRLHLRVLYTGFVGTGPDADSAIGFAARYGTTGKLSRNLSQAYSQGKKERAPTVIERGDYSILYVEQRREQITSIAAGIAPATTTLPDPSEYPDVP